MKMWRLYLVLGVWLISSHKGTAKLLAPSFDCKGITWYTNTEQFQPKSNKTERYSWVGSKPLTESITGLANGETARAMVLYLTGRTKVIVQLWKPRNATGTGLRFELMWKKLIEPPADWYDKTQTKETGFRYIVNLEANEMIALKHDYYLGLYSSGEMPLQMTMDFGHKMLMAINYPAEGGVKLGQVQVFDSLPIPRLYQICFCSQKDCSRKLGSENMQSGKVDFPDRKDDGTGTKPTVKPTNPGPVVVQPGQPNTASVVDQQGLLSHEAIIGIMLWLGVLTLLMMIVLAVLMVICVSSKRSPNPREKSSSEQSLQKA